MAQNVYNVTAADDKRRIPLRGDMSVLFDESVSDSFSVRFFTLTSDFFLFETRLHQFRNLEGQLTSGMMVGGRPGHFIEMMFDPAEKVWFITGNNLVGVGGGGGSSGTNETERTLTMATLPAATPVDYALGKNYYATLKGNARLANPTNMKPGDTLRIVLVQDTVGTRTLAYDGAYGFPDAVFPTLSTLPQSVDVLTCTMTADKSLFCDLRKNYSIIRPLAYTQNFVYTLTTAYNEIRDNPINGQTVQIIRDGYRGEVNGALGFQIPAGKSLNMRVRGKKPDGTRPLLKLERTDRPTFGKAIINIEGGKNVVIEDLRITGATATDAGNGTGILINPNVDYALIKNCHIFDNENGVRSAVSERPSFDLIDCLIENNGRSSVQTHAGQTHNIYAGDAHIWRAERVTFRDSQEGHNIKTRALRTVLKQVYCENSKKSRELDVPDQGIVHVYDSVFWKPSNAGQNNVVGIGHECLDGFLRQQEYFFINCYFHNDVPPTRDVTFLENRRKGDNPNTVAVHFIDCLFGGEATRKSNYQDAVLQGPYTITLTGGPVGPRVPVGDPRALFNMSRIDPRAVTNPTNVAPTPFDQLPAMSEMEPTPPYPEFAEVPIVPPLPSFDGSVPDEDKTPPVVVLNSPQTDVRLPVDVVLTADVTDNVGVNKVEFYRNGVLAATKISSPFQLSVPMTYLDNGEIPFTAKAFDFAGNTATSQPLVISVNIPPPKVRPTHRFDDVLQAAYDAAILSAPLGEKRQAAASAITTTLTSPLRLDIYRDGSLVLPIEFGASLTINNDGYDISVYTPDHSIDSSTASVLTDLNSGDWWFELRGGDAYTNYIYGTVGPADSGADLELDEIPLDGQGLDVTIQLVLPRALDELP